MSNTDQSRIDEHEWDLQERGLRAARNAGAPEADSATESYRRVAAALACMHGSEPPPDFTSAVMMQIARQNAGIERALFRGLSVVLAASALVATALYGEQWLQAVQATSTDGPLQWVWAGTGCVVLSWMIGQLRRPEEPVVG